MTRGWPPHLSASLRPAISQWSKGKTLRSGRGYRGSNPCWEAAPPKPLMEAQMGARRFFGLISEVRRDMVVTACVRKTL